MEDNIRESEIEGKRTEISKPGNSAEISQVFMNYKYLSDPKSRLEVLKIMNTLVLN